MQGSRIRKAFNVQDSKFKGSIKRVAEPLLVLSEIEGWLGG
jgi:hypothetical protein